MPVKADVKIIKHAFSCEIQFAEQGLFCRGPVVANSSLQFARGDQLLDGQGCAETAHTKHIVPASVTGGAFLQRGFDRLGLLRQSRQGVILTQNTNDR